MILYLFSVFDTKVGAFAAPFCGRSKGEAIRSFQVACGDEKLPFKAHPGDYALFFLGEMDDGQGVIKPIAPERIVGADEV